MLAGHGLRLSIHRGALVVRHGFTHYPQRAREDRYFPGDPKLPSRIILLSADGSLSLDVARWLSEQRAAAGHARLPGLQVVSVLGRETAADDLALRRAQIEALQTAAALSFPFAHRMEAGGLHRDFGDAPPSRQPGSASTGSRCCSATEGGTAADHR